MKKEDQELLYQAYTTARRSGSTTWILKAALEQPHCIIVSSSMSQSHFLRALYDKLYRELPFYKRWIRSIFKNSKPLFTTVDKLVEMNPSYNAATDVHPVIFDNEVLQNI